MQLRRKKFGITEERGPRILHLFGGTRNGKSGYSTRLITGREFVKHRMEFSHPLDKLRSDMEHKKVIKPYWDKRWVESEYTPQLILTSNKQCPKGPLTTRVKEIVLDSTYPYVHRVLALDLLNIFIVRTPSSTSPRHTLSRAKSWTTDDEAYLTQRAKASFRCH